MTYSGKSPWTKMKQTLDLEAWGNESFETTRHPHTNQVLVGNHSHMACETRCGRTRPTVISSKCKFGNEHIMGNPITSARGKPKWITSIQTCTHIQSGLFSLPVYDSLCIYFSNSQSIFPYLHLAIHPFVHLHIHLFLYTKNTRVSTTASTLFEHHDSMFDDLCLIKAHLALPRSTTLREYLRDAWDALRLRLRPNPAPAALMNDDVAWEPP